MFLGEHFAKVTIVPLAGFKPEDAQDHDVVIFDWTSIYPQQGRQDRQQPRKYLFATSTGTAENFLIQPSSSARAGGSVAGASFKINWL